MKKYYVYIYLDSSKSGKYLVDDFVFCYEPFYIGKGKDNRCFDGLRDHVKDKTRFNHKLNKLRSLDKQNIKPIVLKLKENLTDFDACVLEKYYIQLIGRGKNGPLVNGTDGGDGMSGTKHSMQWIEKLSIPVNQYDLNMNLIASFNSIKEAALKFNITPIQISRVCSKQKNYKTAAGFIWIFKDKTCQQHFKNEISTTRKPHTELTKSKMKKPKQWKTFDGKHPMTGKRRGSKYINILQFDENNIFIKKWVTITDLCDSHPFAYTNITYAIKNGIKSYGFYWLLE